MCRHGQEQSAYTVSIPFRCRDAETLKQPGHKIARSNRDALLCYSAYHDCHEQTSWYGEKTLHTCILLFVIPYVESPGDVT